MCRELSGVRSKPERIKINVNISLITKASCKTQSIAINLHNCGYFRIKTTPSWYTHVQMYDILSTSYDKLFETYSALYEYMT